MITLKPLKDALLRLLIAPKAFILNSNDLETPTVATRISESITDRNHIFASTTSEMQADNFVSTTTKINISNVYFASAASAHFIVYSCGAQAIKIKGTSEPVTNYAAFGEQSENPLPDYGMYLKTESGDSFSPTNLSMNSTNL